MQRIKMFGLALLAALAVAAIGAASVSATGHEFIANKTGKTKGKNTTIQKFKTGVGMIECTTVSGAGEIKALNSTTHKETLNYSGCSGFGGGATVTPAHFEFNANGSAKLEKRVIITPEGVGCEVLIEPQTVESVTYSNAGGKITAEANVLKIVTKGTGGVCGAENTEGSYTGNIAAELEGGAVEWK
jgi:hypothetical protein